MGGTFRQFRGTLFAVLAFVLVAGAWWTLGHQPAAPKPAKDKKANADGVALFAFEKSDLVKVTVERSDGTINLVEKPDGWRIDNPSGTGSLPASRSMVNRVKHQLHDLVSRATVVEGTGDDALYGLGASAIHVTLQFRDGRTQSFDAGDPNPSGVSFYVRPLPGDVVYTVKKSAVDYYSLQLSEFRERRFASFDSKDVDALNVAWSDGRRLRFQRTGEQAWDLLQPERFAASDDAVRGLMGRVSALKAVEFVTDSPTPEDLARFGLDAPRLTVAMTFSGREALTLLVGANAPSKDSGYDLAYVRTAEDPSVYTARNGLLEDYAQEASAYRLMRFGRMDANRVSLLVATLAAAPNAEDADLNGTVGLRMAADSWLWDDGQPVPGSTPKRVAQRAAGIEGEAFVSSVAADATYGFDHPLVSIRMQDLDGTERTLVIGKPGAPSIDPDGHERARYHARVSDHDEVYLVDSGIVDVVKDLLREHNRKASGDTLTEERTDRIEAERGIPSPLPGQPPTPGTKTL